MSQYVRAGLSLSSLAEDLAGLLEPHPEVTGKDGVFGCGGWTARRDGNRLELTGDGERIDGLRALCAAAWDSPDTVNTADPASDNSNKRLRRKPLGKAKSPRGGAP